MLVQDMVVEQHIPFQADEIHFSQFARNLFKKFALVGSIIGQDLCHWDSPMSIAPQILIQEQSVKKDDVYIESARCVFIFATHPAKSFFQRAKNLCFELSCLKRGGNQHGKIKEIWTRVSNETVEKAYFAFGRLG